MVAFSGVKDEQMGGGGDRRTGGHGEAGESIGMKARG